MLGLAYTLVSDKTYDRDFIRSHCVGFDDFLPYLMGDTDGTPKTPEWAAAITGLPAETVRGLARRMVGRRLVIGISLSLQRAEHGEQAYWMATVLGAMLGQIGLPGGGVGYAWGSNGRGYFGRRRIPFKWASLDQLQNPVKRFIPVARIADMLLSPGEVIDYNGQKIEYPEIALIYWAGGNPFHHHQDLNRLRRAWSKPKTVIVNESVWTATARFADIVFPVTTFAERNDVVCGLGPTITASKQALEPFGDSRNDYAVFKGLSSRLGFEDRFTEGRSDMEWIEHLYHQSREAARRAGVNMPSFDEFWSSQGFSVADQLEPTPSIIKSFRRDPEANPLPTPSGKIEIYSSTIASFRYDDCPGHPVWLDKQEWLGSPAAVRFPIHLLSPQPETRLHSQLDFGRTSTHAKVGGREPLKMSARDAKARGIEPGDVVRVFNDRGACLAGAVIIDTIAPGVAQLATGAWYDPVDDDGPTPLDTHGNPNVLCRDVGTSRLAQGPSAQSCLVEIEKFAGEMPPVRAFVPPPIVAQDDR